MHWAIQKKKEPMLMPGPSGKSDMEVDQESNISGKLKYKLKNNKNNNKILHLCIDMLWLAIFFYHNSSLQTNL